MISSGAGLQPSFHPAVKIFARVISYIFHPLFIPLYVGWFLIYELRLFPDRTPWEQTIVLIQFFVYYTFLPLMTTLLTKSLGFIESIHLKTQRDRIIPYIVCEIFYFWAWYVFRNIPSFPTELELFGLSVFLSCSLGLLLNIYMKVSMHGLSVGVLCGFLLHTSLQTDIPFGVYISIAFLIAGLTLTARLIDSDHSTKEIYTGFFAGAFMVLVSSIFAG